MKKRETPSRCVFHVQRALCVLLLAGMIPVLTNCYGTFPLTRTVYKLNGSITDSQLVHSIILWIFGVFLGVYGITVFVDFVILNLIEFWSGDPIELSQSYEQDDGSVVALGPGLRPNEAVLTVSRDGVVETERRFVRNDEGITTVYDGQGREMGRVVPDGQKGFLFEDASGAEKARLSGTDIKQLTRELAAEEQEYSL